MLPAQGEVDNGRNRHSGHIPFYEDVSRVQVSVLKLAGGFGLSNVVRDGLEHVDRLGDGERLRVQV